MEISRRGLLAGIGGIAALTATGSSSAHANPIPAGVSPDTTGDTIAANYFRTLVPELFTAPPTASAHSDVIVVGTGFGAAVSALRLGQAGARVTMLERGSRWPRDRWRNIHSGDSVPDGRGYWHRRSFTGLTGVTSTFASFGGVFDATDYDGIQVWRGACVGGGSVVFTGVLLEPEQRYFEKVFGSTLGYREMHDQWYPLARKMLRASPMPSDVYAAASFGHSRTWDAYARKAGFTPTPLDGIWDWGVVRDEIALRNRLSATVGESNLGNANGAKRDLSLGYLKEAEATGRVTIHHGHVVHRIGEREGGGYTVEVSVVRPTGEVVSRRTLTCDRLVLGAGSVGTSELLVRARAEGTLTRLDDSVGEGWGSNGDGGLAQYLAPHVGAVQGAPSASGIVDESSGTPVRLENWYSIGLQVNVGALCSLGMALDDTRGAFRYDRARDDVVLDWPKDGNKAAEEAMRHTQERIAHANGVGTGIPVVGVPDVQTQFTAHPLGGAVLGRTCDGYGRVKGHEGLYVMDGAAIPGSTGTANPSLTITALAERNVAEVIRAGM